MAVESRLMSQQLMIKFIEEYKKNSFLWDSNNVKYYNKTGRWEAYRKLVDIVKPYYANADVNFVRKKINTLNGIVRKEHNKYVQSLKNGNNVYKPKLWYYNLMDFIINNDQRYNKSTYRNKIDIDPRDCNIAEVFITFNILCTFVIINIIEFFLYCRFNRLKIMKKRKAQKVLEN